MKRYFLGLAATAALVGWSGADAAGGPFFLDTTELSAQGATALLQCEEKGDTYELEVTGLQAAGVKKSEDLTTVVKKDDLSLVSSTLVDVAQGKALYKMVKSTDDIGPQKDVPVFKYQSLDASGAMTETQPYIEYKVADFLSTLLIAADFAKKLEAGEKKESDVVDLSLLMNRSVRHVQMKFLKKDKFGDPVLMIAAPDAKEGLVVTLAKTPKGLFYPAEVDLDTIRMEGKPR